LKAHHDGPGGIGKVQLSGLIKIPSDLNAKASLACRLDAANATEQCGHAAQPL
jgi:hypothetical protein